MWEVSNGWVGFDGPAFVLGVPKLVSYGGVVVDGEGAVSYVCLQLLEVAGWDGAAVACFE